jgi:hypothetical protein
MTEMAIPIQYVPDPEEEAWHASPAGLRVSADQLRRYAASLIVRAEGMEREANEKEAVTNG